MQRQGAGNRKPELAPGMNSDLWYFMRALTLAPSSSQHAAQIVATSHMWTFKFKLKIITLNLNSVLQTH